MEKASHLITTVVAFLTLLCASLARTKTFVEISRRKGGNTGSEFVYYRICTFEPFAVAEKRAISTRYVAGR